MRVEFAFFKENVRINCAILQNFANTLDKHHINDVKYSWLVGANISEPLL